MGEITPFSSHGMAQHELDLFVSMLLGWYDIQLFSVLLLNGANLITPHMWVHGNKFSFFPIVSEYS